MTLNVGVTYEADVAHTGRHIVVARDTAHGTKEIIATAKHKEGADLIALALNFLCRNAAEAVSQADMLFTYTEGMNDPRL